MPARHRERYSIARRKVFTITLESCSRHAGISVHHALETVNTIDRNMQLIWLFLSIALFVMGFVYGPLGAWLPSLFPPAIRYTQEYRSPLLLVACSVAVLLPVWHKY
jgi:hypothetical protein